jgi:chromatin remodeling complex protein RSC6
MSKLETATKAFTTKAAKAAKATEAPEAAKVVAEAVEVPKVADGVLDSENEYNELQNELTKLQEQVSLCKTKLKKFYKVTSREMNKVYKSKKNSVKRSPTGFDKPTDVPVSLKTLLNISDGEQVARPVITKKIYSYINDNNLRDTTDKRVLRVNDSLAHAFKLTSQEVKMINSSTSVKDESGLNFYNIQKYIKKLYPNDAQAAPDALVASVAPVAKVANKTKKSQE